MENLKNIAYDFILKNYSIGTNNIEIIDLENELLANFEDIDKNFFSLRFYYKDNQPKYEIMKEIKSNKNNSPKEKGQNYALDSLKETISHFEKEEEEYIKIIESDNKDLTLEIKNIKENHETLRKSHELLKKDYETLKNRYDRDKKVYEEVAQFIKSLENRRNITQEQIDLIRKLIQEGKTEEEIVKMSGTSKGTVWRVKKGLL